jgi:acyl-CoA synthetase (AMP-forming)/AMP-acid ligase II
VSKTESGVFTSRHAPLEPPETSLPELVLARALASAGTTALVDGATGERIDYGELAERAPSVAAGLAAGGFAAGDVLGIRVPNAPSWAELSLGAMLAGGAVTGVHPAATDDEAAAQLADAGASLVASGDSPIPAAGGPPPDVLLDPGSLAFLPYSSGTTGRPKGVMLTHGNLTASAEQLRRMLGFGAGDVVLAVAPFAHVMGFLVTLVAPLAAGATVVTMPRFELGGALSLVERHRVTVLVVPPPVMGALARHPDVDRHDLTSVELIVSGGAPLGAELHRAVAARLPKAVVGQGYGLSETAVGVSGPDRRTGSVPGSVGTLMPGTKLRVADPGTDRDADPGAPGELWVRGPQVMPGYLNAPEATAATFTRDGWLRTGDLGRIDGHGNLFVVDRLKELIKVNALQVAPAELEALLLTYPGIEDSAVIPRPDERTGEVPVAVVVASEAVDPDVLMGWIGERVAPHKRIRHVRFVDTIPRTPAGKLLRRRLVEAERAPARA